MRKTKILNFIVATILVTTGYSSKAQTITEFDSLFVSPQDQIENILLNVDKAEINTGYLYEAGFPIIELDRFRGNTNTDDQIDPVKFNLLLATMSSMDLSRSSLITAQSVKNDMLNHSEFKGVPIGIVSFNYNQISQNAIMDNLLYVSGGQLLTCPKPLNT